MFKNAIIYRLPAMPLLNALTLGVHLVGAVFQPCAKQQLESFGFVRPSGEDGAIVDEVQGQLFLRLCVERRPVPGEALRRLTDEMCAALAEAQGFAPGKKARREVREIAADELMAQAIPVRSYTNIWIDPVDGWLVIDTAQAARADLVLKLLLRHIERFPVESFRVQRSPTMCMTGWLHEDEAPAGFTYDDTATLRAPGESKATVQYKRHHLELTGPELQGMQVVRLALTWNGRISFVLDESLTLRSIKTLDTFNEAEREAGDADGRRWLMAAELRGLFADLTAALGGEAEA